jgi:cytoskeletal protein CcmA (bactofilin family)
MLDVKKVPTGPSTRTSAKASTVLAYAEPRTEGFHANTVVRGAGAAVAAAKLTAPALVQPKAVANQQTRMPVIVGEAHYKGMMPIEGVITGQLGSGASLNVKQHSKAAAHNSPELAGDISFRDMLRVNGFIAGTVYSKSGTLIVDVSSRVDANVEVAVAVISGSVNGDIVAHQRVEIGPNAKIHGNIWTRSIEIKDGAIFEGECKMIS